MFRAAFVGRSRELEVLENVWQTPGAALLILYGRRRVGKTRLLTHWLKSHGADGLYWVAEPVSALTQLRSFSQALLSFLDPEADIPPDFTYGSWELALRQLALNSQSRRLVVMIDEVTYLIDVNPDFVGILQKTWDRLLSDANIMLALSGSQMGLMQTNLLNYDAPLHGRATAQVKLPPLPYGATEKYFPGYDTWERVKVYAMWGGVPAYWERLDQQQSIIENLRRNILPAHSWMVDESRILLQDFINDLHNYVGVMRAIAEGQQALGNIAKRTGLSSGKASFYLSVLRDTGFVVRRVPISQRGKDSRRGHYYVTDPYLRFFYRFLSASQSQLALGQNQSIMTLIEEKLPEFIEINTWRELCREWVLRASDEGAVPLTVEEVGSEWARNYMVDVVGIHDSEQNLILGDCFWSSDLMGTDVIEEIVRKTKTAVPKKGEWSVYYVMFSAAGWTEEAKRQAETLVMAGDSGRSRKAWTPTGIRLLDLEQLDEDLVNWSV